MSLRETLAAEARAYEWLDPHRVRTARDPDWAATVARLYDERERQRRRADTAERALRFHLSADLGDAQ